MSATYLVIDTTLTAIKKFASAHDVAVYMWGRIVSRHVILKTNDGTSWTMIHNPSADVDMLEFQLTLN